MANNLSSRALNLVHHGLAHWWVHPLENRVIPWLESGRQTRFRSAILRWVAWCANVGRILVLELRVNVQRWVGSEWSVTYIGDGTSTEYLSSIMFPNEHTVVELPRVFLWQVPALVQKYTGEGDLVVCELNEIARWSLSGVNTFFFVPLWIKQVLEEIDRPMEDILASINRTTRKNIRRLESEEFTYLFTQEEEDFDFFYNRMYLPYIPARHQGQGMVMREYESIHNLFLEGGLILIEDCHEPACSMVCILDDDTCVSCQMGVLDGDFDRVQRGINVALWWSMLDWARSKGARRFDLGGSRAQTSNGGLNFKRLWGTQVCKQEGLHTHWSFYSTHLPTKLIEHINSPGIIAHLIGNFFRVIVSDLGDPLDIGDLSREKKRAAACGFSGLLVLSEGKEQQII